MVSSAVASIILNRHASLLVNAYIQRDWGCSIVSSFPSFLVVILTIHNIFNNVCWLHPKLWPSQMCLWYLCDRNLPLQQYNMIKSNHWIIDDDGTVVVPLFVILSKAVPLSFIGTLISDHWFSESKQCRTPTIQKRWELF